MGIVAGDDVEVAVTDTVGGPANAYLVRARVQDFHLFHHDRLLDLVQDRGRCAHGTPSS
jgi:hypothetical protein